MDGRWFVERLPNGLVRIFDRAGKNAVVAQGFEVSAPSGSHDSDSEHGRECERFFAGEGLA